LGGERRKDLIILRVAMFFTVVSDLFLLLLDYYDLGVMTFCIVQILYLVKLSETMKLSGPDKLSAPDKLTTFNKLTGSMKWSKSNNLVNQSLTQVRIKLFRNIILSFVLLFVLIISKIEIELLLIITIFYFVSIVMNVIDAVRLNRKVNTTANKLFAYGMILFLLCDINVGIFNLSNFVTINNKFFISLYDFTTIGMWMFYLPAQVLIALSGFAQNTTDK
jgi:hypothetical protein